MDCNHLVNQLNGAKNLSKELLPQRLAPHRSELPGLLLPVASIMVTIPPHDGDSHDEILK